MATSELTVGASFAKGKDGVDKKFEKLGIIHFSAGGGEMSPELINEVISVTEKFQDTLDMPAVAARVQGNLAKAAIRG